MNEAEYLDAKACGRRYSGKLPTTSTTDKLLVSPKEAAKLLSISERKLWSMSIENQVIPFIKVGRQTRYVLDDLRKWISELKGGEE